MKDHSPTSAPLAQNETDCGCCTAPLREPAPRHPSLIPPSLADSKGRVAPDWSEQMRLYLPTPIRDPLLGAVSRLETSFDVSLSLKRLKRYGWKWSRDWEYALGLTVSLPPSSPVLREREAGTSADHRDALGAVVAA